MRIACRHAKSKSPTGTASMHARAPGSSSVASHFRCNVSLVSGVRRASARSIVAVMLLAAAVGTTIRVETDGPDEAGGDDARWSSLLSDGFGRAGRSAAVRAAGRAHGELRAPRHRRVRRHRHRPRAARLARDARSRALHDPAGAGRRPRSRASTTRIARSAAASSKALHGAMTSGDAPGEFGAFLDVHWMILNDPTLSEAPKRIIAEQRCNAEWALTQQMDVLVEQFEQIEDPYLRERKADVVQVVERVLKRLMGKPGALPPPRRRGADDPGRARPVAGRRHPVQAAPLRRVPHRPRRRDVAHRDRRAQPQRPGGRRDAQRARS